MVIISFVKSRIVLIFLLLLGGILLFVPRSVPVQAQAGSASDLIGAVNAFRAANGLEPYTVDGDLMSKAQAQSEYQATVGTCTHQRADGSGPGDHGIASENVACGPGLSVSDAIYDQWTDLLHSATMLGPDAGVVGAGVATSGDNVFYTLDVNATQGNFAYRQPLSATDIAAETAGISPPPLPTLAGPIITSTPADDGSVAHVIQYGETLEEIANAYGVTLNDLFAHNASLNPDNPAYYAGQVLIIKSPYTATPEPSLTPTQPTATRTPRPTHTPTRVPSVTPTATSSPTPTATSVLTVIGLGTPSADRKAAGYGLVALCAVGLIFLFVKGFRKGSPG